MATSTKRGHPIFYDYFYRAWFWQIDGLPISLEKPCSNCDQMPDEDGIDACLGGRIEDVISACCGHGKGEPIITKIGVAA